MRAFDMSHALLHSECRYAHIALPRQIAMTLMHEHGMTWEDAAGHFKKDHGTAIYAAKMISQRENIEIGFADTMQDLRTQIAETLQSSENSHTSVQTPDYAP